MPNFKTTRRVPFTPEQMFALVADVARYPEFLPFCEKLTVLSRAPTPTGETLDADMQVGYGPVRETFRSRVGLIPSRNEITSTSIAGPFAHMNNVWRFTPAPGGCDIAFSIDYSFRNALLGMLVGSMFDTAFRRYAEAFERRASVVYARPTSPVPKPKPGPATA
jgi:coenzyme Q-binding protein COQ10